MKRIITVVLTAVLFVAAVVLGVNSVYRVTEVGLDINFVSEEAKAEAEELKARLLETYDKRSVFDVAQEDSDAVFAEFSYFRLTAFEKQFPNKIKIEATEDAEVFAVASGESYYILGLDGTILSIRENSLNRSDGKPNVLIEGLEVSGENGKVCEGEKFTKLLPFLQQFSSCLNGLRSNVVKIEYRVYGGNVEQYDFTMREGVKLMLQKAEEFVEEKANLAAQKYLGLKDVELLSGYLYATNSEEKAAVVYYPTEIPLE